MNRLERIRSLLDSGELSSRAARSANMDQFLAGIGLSRKQWQDARNALSLQGVNVPTIAELRVLGKAGPRPEPIVDVDPAFDDFESEDPTNPGVGFVPDGHYASGYSTLERGGPDDNFVLRWTKTGTNKAQHLESVINSIRELGPTLPRAEPVVDPTGCDDELLAVYPIGDAHLGMLAWGEECGENFDLEIAERNLCRAIDHLVALAPAAKRALVINVGDFVHADGLGNTTTKGTRVDVDGRWPKIIRTAVRAKRRIISRCLERHEHVTDWNLRGNHDDLSAMVLSIALAQFYENEPRVAIEQSPAMFYAYRFGECLIASTHGDKMTPQAAKDVLANDWAADWGQTKFRRIYGGHEHHEMVKELVGATYQKLRTLASSDAWHKGQGYRAGRDLTVDIWHARYGLVNRHIVGIEQLRAA